MTCGWQRNEYGSCTREQSRCEARISLPRSERGIRAATAICPGWPRISWMRSSNGVSLAFSASTDMAPATMAAASTSSAPNNPARASAVDTCVPLMSARPSLAPSLHGARPARARPSAAASTLPPTRTWPMPSNAALKCASGARSPEAPTDPCAGNHGVHLVREQRAQGVDQRQRNTGVAARQRIDLEREDQAHHRHPGAASPTPAACESNRLRCSWASCSSGMRVCASSPKPVLMP